MTDQEIIVTYTQDIDEDVQNICTQRNIINDEEIKQFSETYRQNFIKAFKEGQSETLIEIRQNLLSQELMPEKIQEIIGSDNIDETNVNSTDRLLDVLVSVEGNQEDFKKSDSQTVDQGITLGHKKGQEQMQKSLALKMLAGGFDPQSINDATFLSLENIETLRQAA